MPGWAGAGAGALAGAGAGPVPGPGRPGPAQSGGLPTAGSPGEVEPGEPGGPGGPGGSQISAEVITQPHRGNYIVYMSKIFITIHIVYFRGYFR